MADRTSHHNPRMGGGRREHHRHSMSMGRRSVVDQYGQEMGEGPPPRGSPQMGRKARIPPAYPVTMLVDLQVYVVPRDKWVLSRRLYRHNIVEEGISLGFLRVLPQLSIHNLRRELQLQLGPDVLPRDYIFVRAVGNIFIQLKPKQEIELKVKNFIPPFSPEPEIYLLEVLPNEDPSMMLSMSPLSPLPHLPPRDDTPPHICHDFCHHSRAQKRDELLREITDMVGLRHEAEVKRSELLQRVSDLQSAMKEKQDKVLRRNEYWHKMYIEECSATRPLEASCTSIRSELNTVMRRLLAHLEGRDLPLRLRDGPSKKANYKIMAARLQHEIKELQQKVKAAKLRLDSEMSLKEQGEREVRELRNDLAHKKMLMSLARSQSGAVPTMHSRSYDSLNLLY